MVKDSFVNSFREFLRQSQVNTAGRKIIVAVSGGIDSMVLLHLLHEVQSEQGTQLAVAHFNHQLRGKESDDDEAFVCARSKTYGLECYIERADTAALAESQKRSLQEIARDLRYAFFSRLRLSLGFDFIATGHHCDDNAETLVFNLFRGAGVQGLSGIPFYRKDLSVIRPLLFASRDEVAAFALSQNLPHREDSSNASTHYTRNFLRQTLLPLVREHINPNLTVTLRRTSELFSRLQDFIASVSAEASRQVVRSSSPEEIVVGIPQLHRLEVFLQEHLLHQFAQTMAHSDVDFTTVQSILRLSHGASGTSIRLSATVAVYNDRDRLIFTSIHHPQHYQYRVELNCRHDFEAFSFNSSAVAEANLSDDPNTEFIDAALLGKELVLRNWREGDWFVPFGMRDRKKVSDFFIDTKVSHLEKSSIPIFVSDDQIVWICGKRLDNRFRISPQTRSIVKLEYLPRSFAG